MDASNYTVVSYEQLIPTFIKYVNIVYEQELDTAQNMGTILSSFFEKSLISGKLIAAFDGKTASKTSTVKKTSVKTTSDGSPVKKRPAKAVEKYTAYDCYMKTVGEEWKALEQSEKDKWINPAKLDKNGKVISSFINYKSRWTSFTAEQKQHYIEIYKSSHSSGAAAAE